MADRRDSWAGTTLSDRRSSRREQLLEAALTLVADAGTGALTVRAVCRTSGLTERYFYESFADRTALLIALSDRVTSRALEVVTNAATRAAAAIDRPLADLEPHEIASMTAEIVHAFTSHLLDDPRQARVLLVESFADPTLTEQGLAAMPRFAAVVAATFSARWHDTIDAVDAELSGQAVVGALVHLYLGWLRGDLDIDRERLERHAVVLLTAIGPTRSSA